MSLLKGAKICVDVEHPAAGLQGGLYWTLSRWVGGKAPCPTSDLALSVLYSMPSLPLLFALWQWLSCFVLVLVVAAARMLNSSCICWRL
mmetsp:Transcript_43205/g.104268  ORF Transcript_43205/g.104268 Transcript_43205/m.104268 type:complete len:89 (+) Transcript_43205:1718-1984(+)